MSEAESVEKRLGEIEATLEQYGAGDLAEKHLRFLLATVRGLHDVAQRSTELCPRCHPGSECDLHLGFAEALAGPGGGDGTKQLAGAVRQENDR